MKKSDKNTIIFGIGNNGRQDDGLGWSFLDFLDGQQANIDLEYRYQLQIEDAELISSYQTVFFVDATKECTKNGFFLAPCHPSEEYSFSTHALKPETILYLSNKLYGHNPQASIFGIQGYDWELKIGLSERGIGNLNKAGKYFKDKVLINYFD